MPVEFDFTGFFARRGVRNAGTRCHVSRARPANSARQARWPSSRCSPIAKTMAAARLAARAL